MNNSKSNLQVNILEEHWKPIPDCPNFWISNLGRYKKADSEYDDINEKIYKPKISKGKWLVTMIRINGKLIYKPIARLVAQAFVNIPERYKNIPIEKLKVRNKDENFLNNRADNLEWYSHSEMYSDKIKEKMSDTMSKLSVTQFDKEGNWIANFKTLNLAAKKVNGTRNTIWNAAAGNAYSAYGYYWEFTKPEYKEDYILDISNKAPIIDKASEYEYLTREDIERLKTEQEIWRDIPGYENLYQASNYGRIRSLQSKSPIIMKENIIQGYMRVGLRINKIHKEWMVHRLIAMTFIPIPQELLDQGYTYDTLQVNHKDECKTNNKVENLEWCTREYNVNYGTCQQRKAESNGIKRTLFDKQGNVIKTFISAAEIGRLFNIKSARINEAIQGKHIKVLDKYIVRNWIPEYDKPGFNLFQ